MFIPVSIISKNNNASGLRDLDPGTNATLDPNKIFQNLTNTNSQAFIVNEQ